MVILTLLFLGLKYCGIKICRPRPIAIKLFTLVIYHHTKVITVVTLFYSMECRYYHGRAVNYHSKKFYNIGPSFKDVWIRTEDFTHYTVVGLQGPMLQNFLRP
jgi:hypothetical protein